MRHLPPLVAPARLLSLLPLLPLLLGCAGCGGARKHPVDFYYWKADVSLGETEQRRFAELKCRRLYLRFFDVDIDKDAAAVPVAVIAPFDPAALDAEYVPVVFVANRVFARVDAEGARRLARKVGRLVEAVRARNRIPASREIQIDCDWTAGTRDAYFAFLKELRAASGKEISCTLRLHQVKFRKKAGIPPVAKTVLMCYATSGPEDASGRNSILDMALLRDYTRDINSYPLAFDVALPLYSWAVATNHLGEVKLINNVTRRDCDPAHFRRDGDGLYTVKEDFFFRGLYLNKGFTLRTEGIAPELLRAAKGYLDGKIRKDYSVVYYHLDRPFLENFSLQDLE